MSDQLFDLSPESAPNTSKEVQGLGDLPVEDRPIPWADGPPPERQAAIDKWLSTRVGVCPDCEQDIFPTTAREIGPDGRLYCLGCAPTA